MTKNNAQNQGKNRERLTPGLQMITNRTAWRKGKSGPNVIGSNEADNGKKENRKKKGGSNHIRHAP